MIRINYDYYDKKDIYNDGDIEKKLFDYYKSNMCEKKYDDSMFYLTSNIRENILNWYPFKKNSSLLEIGSGVGTITGMLCEKVNHVTSVEGSKRRCEVIAERCKNYNNLDIYAGNILDLKIEKKFDYIILIGVFEYTKMFVSEQNPFEYFLNVIKSLLKENGKILIAIENRYGIKYFAGCTEDHYEKKYVGLYGYENLGIQTFGKQELIDLFNSCGIKKYKFYYPFPDYKMPMVIYTDNKYPSLDECYQLPIYNHGNQVYNFDYRLALSGIIDNGMFSFFSNSFLIELGNDKSELSNIKYVKHQPYRNKEYSTITLIDDDNKVYKIPAQKDAIKHLKTIETIHNNLNELGIKASKSNYNNGTLKFEYINGKSVYDIVCDFYKKNDYMNMKNEITNYISFIKECSISKKIEKPIDKKLFDIYKDKQINILKYGLLDFNMGNVIKSKNGYVLIDQEWVSDLEIPTDYSIYFSIKMLKETLKKDDDPFDFNLLFKTYKITKKMQILFDNISINYFDKEKKFKNIDVFKKLLLSSVVTESVDLERRINEVCKNYELEIDNITNNQIPSIKNNYEKEIDHLNKEIIPQMKNNYEKEINHLNKEIIPQMKNNYEKEIDHLNKEIIPQMKNNYEKEIDHLNKEIISQMKNNYEKEINHLNKEIIPQMKNNYEKEINHLNSEIIPNICTEYEKKLNKILIEYKEYKNNISNNIIYKIFKPFFQKKKK